MSCKACSPLCAHRYSSYTHSTQYIRHSLYTTPPRRHAQTVTDPPPVCCTITQMRQTCNRHRRSDNHRNGLTNVNGEAYRMHGGPTGQGGGGSTKDSMVQPWIIGCRMRKHPTCITKGLQQTTSNLRPGKGTCLEAIHAADWPNPLRESGIKRSLQRRTRQQAQSQPKKEGPALRGVP